MVKLLFICQSLNSDLRNLFELKKSLRSATILFSDDPELSLSFNFQPNRMRALLKRSNWTAVLPNLLAIRRLGIGYVVFDDPSPFYLVYGVLLRLCGIRLVFTFHDQVAHEGWGCLGMNFYVWFASRFLANRITVFSPCNLKTDAVVHQFQLSGYQGELHKVSAPPETTDLQVLVFGRIKRYKGYKHLAEIALRTSNFPVHFRVVGSGESELLRPLLSLPNVTIEDRYVEDEELAELFSHSHLNLLPYNSATQSGVALLAASFGVPTLAFDVGSLDCYLAKGIGETVPPFNYDEMVHRILSFAGFDAQTLKAARTRTRKSYDSHYSAATLQECYCKLCRDLIAEKEAT
jgi:glycosyltransferase involved in cell wall biosynthesis